MAQSSVVQADKNVVRALSAMVRPPLARSVWRANILVVEDDAADTRLILRALKANPDVAEVVTRNLPGRALLELAAGRFRPTIIFLDIRMPRIDGFRFLDALRVIPSMSDVPVVFLTTSALSSDVARASDRAANGYIVKPDSFEELKERLDGVIQQVVSGCKKT
jgi:CheY-like chemotaxis protein